MSEWRDISTAPKDGTVFLAWGRFYASPVTAMWFERSAAFFPVYDLRRVIDWQSDCDTTYEALAPCTHWHPLPTLPEAPK